MIDSTAIGLWGLGTWRADYHWDRHDPRRGPLVVDRYDGRGYWARHSWVSDFWLRW